MKLLGGLIVVLMLAGCHYAPDRPMPTQEQKLAMAEFNKQQAVEFDLIMDELEAKMIEAGAYTPGKVYESRNIYPAGTETLGSTIK